MLCDLCHKNMATVHLTEIVDDKVVELHICQECARSKADELKQQLSLPEFLSGLVSSPEIEQKETDIQCSVCGMSFYDFKKKGMLGCSYCYRVFKQQLLPLIKKLHGSINHKGKRPITLGERGMLEKELILARERLERAIQLEEYEEAARLRDKIRKLEKKLRSDF